MSRHSAGSTVTVQQQESANNGKREAAEHSRFVRLTGPGVCGVVKVERELRGCRLNPYSILKFAAFSTLNNNPENFWRATRCCAAGGPRLLNAVFRKFSRLMDGWTGGDLAQ